VISLRLIVLTKEDVLRRELKIVPLDYMQYPTIVGFPDFSGFSLWWEVSKTDTFSLSYVFCPL